MKKHPLPHVDPIRPSLSKVVPLGREWVYELKLDGFRGVLHVEDGRGYFTSKNNRVMRRFESLADTLARSLNVRSAILDGEIVVMREGMPDFYALMFRRGEPQYAAFDLLWLNGRDLREATYRRRKGALRRLLADQTAVGYVDSYSASELFDAAVRLDLEGVVAKRMTDVYAPSTIWLKIKHGGYSKNEGRWELFARRVR